MSHASSITRGSNISQVEHVNTIKWLTWKSMLILHFQKSKFPIKYIMRLEPWLLTLQKNQQIQSLHSSLASLV